MISYLVLFFIRFYQKIPLSSHHACRFRPTCSEYLYQAIKKYGIMRGGLKGLKRFLHCHPWSKGGYQPLEE